MKKKFHSGFQKKHYFCRNKNTNIIMAEKFGKTWWGEHWLRSLENVDYDKNTFEERIDEMIQRKKTSSGNDRRNR
jgi:hypothetical protein